MDLSLYRKALIPVAMTVILGILSGLNITPDMTVQDAITLLLTAVLVYFVPNKKA